MNKYIDAEKLIERLEEMKRAEYENCGGVNSKTGALQEVQELIESLQQEQPTKGYDEKYLNEKIAKAKKSWEGVDVDKYMDDVRGREQQEQPIKVYRVENEKEQKGLWRKFDGTWEPLFDMLTDGQCKDMPMEDSPIYREGGKQWFASAPSKETLQKWFSKRDLEELTAKGFTISEFEVVGHKKVSDFEYIFTRDSIISRTYLEVSDIYPQEQPEVDLEEYIENEVKHYGLSLYEASYGTFSVSQIDRIIRNAFELGLNARKEKSK